MHVDILIVRPYTSLPSESAGIDRYLSLSNAAREIGLHSLVVTSTYRHNAKSHRSPNTSLPIGVEMVNAGQYSANISLSRVVFEFRFAVRAYFRMMEVRPKVVLVGEPLGFAWLIFWFGRQRFRYVLVGDVIDLFPEAYFFKLKSAALRRLMMPLKWLRDFRISHVYDRVTTVSTSYASLLVGRRSLPARPVPRVYYWGSGVSRAATGSVTPSRKPNRAIYAGSLGEGYDIELLIELARRRPNIEIVIAGSGPKADMVEKSAKEGLLTFLGSLDPARLELELRASSIGLLPYMAGSAVAMPIKFFEYINCHLVVVNSLRLECAEVISETGVGVNYIAGDIDSFSRALDVASMMKVSDEQFGILESRYCWQRQYQEFAVELADIVANRRR